MGGAWHCARRPLNARRMTGKRLLKDHASSLPMPFSPQAWGQRMQQYIVHGSPQWHVYRCLPAFPDGTPAASGSAAALGGRGSSSQPRGRPAAAVSRNSGSSAASSSSGSLVLPSDEELSKYAEAADGAAPLPSTKQQTASGLSIVSGDDEGQTVLDWKGEPMQVRPGDRLPGVKFL